MGLFDRFRRKNEEAGFQDMRDVDPEESLRRSQEGLREAVRKQQSGGD
jgi:hypothetical protein